MCSVQVPQRRTLSLVSSADVMWVPSPALGLGVGVPRVGLRPRSSGRPSPPRDPHPLSCCGAGPALLDSPSCHRCGFCPSWLGFCPSVLCARRRWLLGDRSAFQLRIWEKRACLPPALPSSWALSSPALFLGRQLGGLCVLAVVGAGSTETLQGSDFTAFSCESRSGVAGHRTALRLT